MAMRKDTVAKFANLKTQLPEGSIIDRLQFATIARKDLPAWTTVKRYAVEKIGNKPVHCAWRESDEMDYIGVYRMKYPEGV